MSEWKEYKLGDIIKVKHGYAFSGEHITSIETDKILVTPGNFHIGGGFKSDKFKYYNSNDFPQEYMLHGGDIIVTMTDLSKDTDTLGYSAKVPNNISKLYLHNQRIGLLQFRSDKVYPDFVYWLMRTKEYQSYIVGSASGTSIMHTSPSRIEAYSYLFPPIEEQKRIAGVLSSLDDKIDLLNRENATLEALAETLFRHYFIENPNPDWKEGRVSDFGKVICGKTPSKKVAEYYGGNIPFIKIPDMHGNTFVFRSDDSLSERGKNSQKDKTLPIDSIMVSCIATVGLVSMNAYESHTNQQINSVVPSKASYRYYLYCWFRSMYDELNTMASGGTATLNLNTGDFSRIVIPIPDNTVIESFDSQVKPLFEKIKTNQQQIISLSAQRDTLLPKLMSNEITI